jgi:hypothetical protein
MTVTAPNYLPKISPTRRSRKRLAARARAEQVADTQLHSGTVKPLRVSLVEPVAYLNRVTRQLASRLANDAQRRRLRAIRLFSYSSRNATTTTMPGCRLSTPKAKRPSEAFSLTAYDSNTHSPPVIVRSMGIEISVAGFSRSGSRPSTTRSASLPSSIEPFRFSSYDA